MHMRLRTWKHVLTWWSLPGEESGSLHHESALTIQNVSSRSEFYDSEIVELAFLTILKHVLESGHHARYLIKSIEKCPREGIVCIFAGTIRLWLECLAMQIRDDTLRHAAPLNNIRGTRTEVE